MDITTLENWLWDAACSIRGPLDAPKYKDYLLPLLFYKRLSDVYEDELRKLSQEFGDEALARQLAEEDRALIRFYLPNGHVWPEVRKSPVRLGERLTEAMREIAKENPKLKGVIDIVDFNATAAGQRILDDDTLARLMEILNRQRLGLRDVEPDILGRAYEYLLRKFAEGSGQSAGEFYTPKEVATLMATILDAEEGETVYDPACGSGGLLIKAQLRLKEKVAGRLGMDVHDLKPGDVQRPLQLYGQEINHVTYAMCKMNAFVHDMEAEIALGDTMKAPRFTVDGSLRTFDKVTANPMWNQKFGTEVYENDPFNRFTRGTPPASSADWGWIQHMVASLKPGGKMAVVLDTGAVSRGSGNQGSNKERDARRAFVEGDLLNPGDLVEAVVLLPENLFYNTSAPGIILVMRRGGPGGRPHAGEILLINASKLCAKGRPKNYLTDDHIRRIYEVYRDWRAEEGLSAVITTAEAARNDYNLSRCRWRRRWCCWPRRRRHGLRRMRNWMPCWPGWALGSGAVAEPRPTVQNRFKDTDIGPIPVEWEVVSLCYVTERTLKRDPRKLPDEAFRYIDVSSVSNETYLVQGWKDYLGGDAPSRARKVVRTGDILFATVRPYLRKIAQVPRHLDNEVCSTGLCVIRAKPAKADPDYLFYVALSDAFIGRIVVQQRGSSYPAVSDKVVLSELIPLPPLPEQRRIAHVLSTIQRAVAAQEDVIVAAKETKRSLMQRLFTYGPGAEPAATKETEIGEIPVHWEVVRPEQLVDVKGGKRLPKGQKFADSPTDYPYIRVVDFENNPVNTTDLRFITREIHERIKWYTISSEDVYISIAGTTGIVGSVPWKLDGANLTENAAKLVIKNRRQLERRFLVYALASDKGQAEVSRRTTKTSQPKLALMRINQIPIPVPSLSEQERVVNALFAIDSKIGVEQQRKAALQALLQSMLQQLMTGQVRVTSREGGE